MPLIFLIALQRNSFLVNRKKDTFLHIEISIDKLLFLSLIPKAASISKLREIYINYCFYLFEWILSISVFLAAVICLIVAAIKLLLTAWLKARATFSSAKAPPTSVSPALDFTGHWTNEDYNRSRLFYRETLLITSSTTETIETLYQKNQNFW